MSNSILIVDDSRLNIRLLTDVLEKEGFEVNSADNGLVVLEMARRLNPDVILLDIIMPGIDGFEVCRILKSHSDVMDIPVIMVTAKTEGNDIRNAMELGAFDYIKKPIDEVEVIARVQSALRFKEYQDKLKELATKDGLTGLYNHALLMELFEKEISKQQRTNGLISFVMIDIDFFKKVNDTYGHLCGNIVLKEISNILVNSVRKGDIVSRFGGEEFGIVLLAANKIDTYNICEKIRKNIEGYNFNIGCDSIKITVSIGAYAKELEEKVTVYEIIHKADEELYKAKDKGRNRVEIR